MSGVRGGTRRSRRRGASPALGALPALRRRVPAAHRPASDRAATAARPTSRRRSAASFWSGATGSCDCSQRLYWTVTFVGSLILLSVRRFCPGRARLAPRRDRRLVRRRRGAGGVWFAVETNDPDSDLGPVLARVDAPLLFSTIEKVGRRLGVKPPVAGSPDLSALLRRGGLGPVAGPADRASALSGAHPRGIAGHRRARAGPPGARRRHRGRPVGPVCRGARTGRRAERPARSRALWAPGPDSACARHPG